MKGIQSQWNGVQTEWFRRYGDSADLVHCRRDRHFNTSGNSGNGKLDGMFLKPKKAVAIRIKIPKHSKSTGPAINKFSLIAQTLEISPPTSSLLNTTNLP